MQGKKKVWIFLGATILVVACASFALFLKQMSWVETPTYAREATSPARTLVVAYSRTGNTLGAAKEAARFFDAELLRIRAPQYGLTLEGQFLAAEHADEQVTTTAIEHDAVNLSDYDRIILCSPIWWFRPAPPLWAFVENHDFAGKPVFLLVTGNSRLKEAHTREFQGMVEQRNGTFVGAHFIRRGRFYWQKSTRDVAIEVREALEVRRGMWPIRGRRSRANAGE